MSTPYYAVIFTSEQTNDTAGYAEMADAMENLAKQQSGYIGMEHARDGLAITISYWETLEDIARWKENLDHLQAQKLGRERWYQWYKTRICKVEREYEFHKS
ncbi:antibiotic biosynthesis monooxygenase [Aureisphaera galaxeae]|uniref:antibiotic biosynthesis monooxygenase family protein n=1 Tax=Aureisphaera galaxeae TaxID=1538023 RepID=UPI002350AF82|nr:antibiotic biosynthesis monooxygenase [Aureisphaera galaxeae]MDC8005270.1 antibiotic biosynthesis monooxygenase [Aureisphaera galaxeae]